MLTPIVIAALSVLASLVGGGGGITAFLLLRRQQKKMDSESRQLEAEADQSISTAWDALADRLHADLDEERKLRADLACDLRNETENRLKLAGQVDALENIVLKAKVTIASQAREVSRLRASNAQLSQAWEAELAKRQELERANQSLLEEVSSLRKELELERVRGNELERRVQEIIDRPQATGSGS